MGGSLCSKAQHIYYISQRDKNLNPARFAKVLHRKPNSGNWEELDFSSAIEMVVERVKKTRDNTFKRRDDSGNTVNRCEGIGFIGGSVTNNEPDYAFSKLLRAMGCVYVDNEARDSYAPAIKAMRETFGRPGMTNTIPDIRHANQVLVVGANPAADHPVIMRWLYEAQDNKPEALAAKIIVVDPRLSRTAAKATMHVRIRPGTDLALIGGMINYILSDPGKPYQERYMLRHTDATFILDKAFLSAQDKKGVFSGYNAETRSYDKGTWKYRFLPEESGGAPRQDPLIQEPRAVLNVLRKHFERYRPTTVCRICGITTSQFNELCKTYASTHRKGESGVVLFGRGVMSQASGAQTVRAIAILQLLLGNIGVPGGGMVPLMTSSNTQGACDMGLLAEYLPGYLEMPIAQDKDFETYINRVTPFSMDVTSHNEWKNYKTYMINLLRAFFADAATKDNGWGYYLLPRLDPDTDYTTGGMFEAMDAGTLKGLIVLGENPAVGPNGSARRKAMSKLDWLVVHEIFESDTAAFWKSAEGKGSGTEVFLFPAPTVAEITGSVTNMSRWVQWQKAALTATVEDSNREAIYLADGLIDGLKQAYQSGGEFPDPITSLAWKNLRMDPKAQLDPEVIMFEIAGRETGDLENVVTLKDSQALAADGSTCCGCWLYAGATQKYLSDRSAHNSLDSANLGLYRDFAWSWPNNVRIMYNRASMGKEGKPFDDARQLVSYFKGKWKLNDGVDGPDTDPEKLRAFTATPVGVGKLFAEGMVDGPFPEFYEPLESGIKNWIEPAHQTSPVLKIKTLDKLAAFGTPEVKQYPVIGLTYSLAGHHGYGQVTRYSKGAKEIIPAFFIEVGADLAQKKGIANGDKVRVKSIRFPEGIVGHAVVTGRLKAVRILKEDLYMVAVPENFGFVEEPLGAPAHDLTLLSGDPNTSSAACRMFLCDIAKA
jgi:formate dehydrogenase major subunit